MLSFFDYSQLLLSTVNSFVKLTILPLSSIPSAIT